MQLPSPTQWLHYAVLVLALTVTSACQQVKSQNPGPESLPQDPFVQVYFNHDLSAEYQEPYRPITRSGHDFEQKIIDAIQSAQSTVDVAVQEFRLPRIAQALVDRQKAGVQVRVILENTYSRPWSSFTDAELAKLPERERDRYQEYRQLGDRNGDGQLSQEEINQADTLVMLQNAKIPWIDDTADGSAGSSLMHHKFVVVDGRQVLVTSANFTPSDIHGDFKSTASRGNANNFVQIDSAEVARLFTQEFSWMWGDGPGGKPDSKFGVNKPQRPAQPVQLGKTAIAVQFSPSKRSVPWTQTSNGLIGQTLSTATQSVDLALFVFSDQKLSNLLEPLHQRGAQIRALISPGFAYRSYSEGLDLLGVALADENCKYQANNRPWQTPISTVGVPRLAPGDLLHHKFGVVDRKTVITGSHNWTDAANTGNDETVLVIQNPTVAAHYMREYERLYEDAILGVPPAIQRRAQEQQEKCPQPGPEAPMGLVNLNTATQAELEALPGIGPALAKRIMQARQEKPFTSLEDLRRVSGVGPKLLDQLDGRVTW